MVQAESRLELNRLPLWPLKAEIPPIIGGVLWCKGPCVVVQKLVCCGARGHVLWCKI